MTEIGGRGFVPHGENGDLLPGDVGKETDGEGFVAIGAVEGRRGDLEAGSEVVEGVAGSAPPQDAIRSGEHVELGDGEGAAVEDVDDATELVLNHGEVGAEAGKGGVLLAS